jgi:hypothetical protein
MLVTKEKKVYCVDNFDVQRSDRERESKRDGLREEGGADKDRGRVCGEDRLSLVTFTIRNALQLKPSIVVNNSVDCYRCSIS